MRLNKWTVAALAWASLGALSARADKIIDVKQVPVQQPIQVEVVEKDGKVIKVVRGGGQPMADNKTTATSADPGEPPLQVEMTTPFAGRGFGPNAAGTKVEVTSGPRGTMLKVPTNGSWSGSTSLKFKNTAAPMRFTVQLTGLPQYDLQSLSLTSGSVTLQVGSVGTGGATKYFDAKGKEQQGATGAAYTLTAKRGDKGQVDLELRRAAGGTLGKDLSLTWQSNIEHIKFGRGGRFGG